MVRQIARTGYGWKAALAIAVAAGALLWHVLACIESPMAFSPSGKDLAFVIIAPAGDEENNVAIQGSNIYRLMILSDRKDLRVVETSTDSMLSGPAYSPDGKHYCHLRVSLYTKEDLEKLEERSKKEEAEEKKPEKKMPAVTTPANEPVPKEIALWDNLTLPSVEFHELMELVPESMSAVLVVRDAKTDAIVSSTSIELLFTDDEEMDQKLLAFYLTARPQYGPEGKWIYLCAGNVVVAVNPSEGKGRYLAAPALVPVVVPVAALAPDGKTIAVLQEQSDIAFIQTDGKCTTYCRIDGEIIKETSPFALAWMDKQTVALLGENPEEGLCLLRIRTNGDILKPLAIKLGEKAVTPEEVKQSELAVAPDGKHMVLGFGASVFFMKTGGTVLKRWESQVEEATPQDIKYLLTQPTFTPDSKQVAFKRVLGEKDGTSVVSIIFFTPDGQEIWRTAIPEAKPAEKPEAEPPAEDEPLEE